MPGLSIASGAAVVAITTPGSLRAHYLTSLPGQPSVATGDVVAWRVPSRETGFLRGDS